MVFFEQSAIKVAAMYGNKFNWRMFDFLSYFRDGLFLVCYKDDRPVGAMLARLFESIFDPDTKILFQDLLYVNEAHSRAAYLLLMHFIDFGKENANHIITTIAPKTNIKGKSLERLGFNKMEELYRMEITK